MSRILVFFLVAGFLSCQQTLNDSALNGAETELAVDTNCWTPVSLVVLDDTIDLELDHIIYRIDSLVTGKWSYENDSLKWLQKAESCSYPTLWSDSVIFTVPCAHFYGTIVKPCEQINDNLIASNRVRFIDSFPHTYKIDDSKILLERKLFPLAFLEKIRTSYLSNPDTIMVFN